MHTVTKLLMSVLCLTLSSMVLRGEVRVMCPGAYVDVLTKLSVRLERATAQHIVIIRDGPTNIPNRVRAGEAIDLVILPQDALDKLVSDGFIAMSSRRPLVRSNIGMIVQEGAPKPEINSVEALKRTLLAARSIALSSQISGMYFATELVPRIGISEELRGKMKRIEKERVGAVVARGEAEIGFQQISELLGIPGTTYVGPLPPEVQRATVFSIGVAVRSSNAAASEDVIKFLMSPEARELAATSGLEPILAK